MSELWDSLKKATKPSFDRFDKLDKNYIFYLEEMVTPKLLTIFYWILLFAFITKGIGDIFEGDFFRGLVWVVGGSLASRVACELVVVLFRINETLHEISDNTKDIDSSSNNDSEKNQEKPQHHVSRYANLEGNPTNTSIKDETVFVEDVDSDSDA